MAVTKPLLTTPSIQSTRESVSLIGLVVVSLRQPRHANKRGDDPSPPRLPNLKRNSADLARKKERRTKGKGERKRPPPFLHRRQVDSDACSH